MSCCHYTELKFHTNGIDSGISPLSYYWKQAEYLTEKLPTHFPPESWVYDASQQVLEALELGVESSSAAKRNNYIRHVKNRYSQTIPLDTEHINREVKLASRQLKLIKEECPVGLFIHNRVNQRILRSALSKSEKANWPTQYSHKGELELKLDKSTLKDVGGDIAMNILDFKKSNKIQMLQHLKTDQNEKHRFWSNPFGTITGRDKPTGFNLMYVSKNHRKEIIVAEPDSILVLLDYDQEEYLVVSSLANDFDNINEYEKGDLYGSMGGGDLARNEVKIFILAYLYGQRLSVDAIGDKLLHSQMRERFSKIDGFLDRQTIKAFNEGLISSSNWQMHVRAQRTLTIRNWIVQATAASILREACLLLDESNITVVATFHDAILIKCALETETGTTKRASNLMVKASNNILNNASLRVSVEAKFYPKEFI